MRRLDVTLVCVAILCLGGSVSAQVLPTCSGTPTYRYKVQGSTDGGMNYSDGSGWIYVYPNYSVNVKARTLMTVTSGQTQGWSFGLEHYTPYWSGVTLLSATTAGTQAATCQNGQAPDYNDTAPVAGYNGYTSAIVIDNNSVHKLNPVTNFTTSTACYGIQAPSTPGTYYLTLRFTHDIGNPKVWSVIGQNGLPNIPCADTFTYNIYVSTSVQPTPSAYCPGGGYGPEMQSEGETLEPREPLAKEELIWDPENKQRLVVKFVDEASARAGPDGSVMFLGESTTLNIDRVLSVTKEYSVTFSPLIDLPNEKIETLRRRAAQNSGRAQPDLAGMLIANVKDDTTEAMLAAAKAFLELGEIEYAYLETPDYSSPSDIPPTTPLFQGNQRYRDPDPGMDINFAFESGAKGQGVRLTDVERNWLRTHEDLVDVSLPFEAGHTPVAAEDPNHGTGVLGIICSKENDYGCTGLSPDANVHLYPINSIQGGQRLLAAITSAIADSDPGDIVLIEQQLVFLGGIPVETNQGIWTAIKAGTDAGVIVIEGAGNGNVDLDSNQGGLAAWRARGDSGAIIVGGGTDTFAHDRWVVDANIGSSFGSIEDC